MKFQSSTLFVNTGRKPLPGMQKKKKTNKNNIALGVCIAIITVLCIFVGLIVHVWLSYNENEANKERPSQTETEVREVKPVEEKPENTAVGKVKPQTGSKPKKPAVKEEKPVPENPVSGEETPAATAVNKEFKNVSAEYSFGIMNLADGSTYINNTEKIHNSAALAPFLAEYVSNGIYLGTFDYYHEVEGYLGSYLMDRAFTEGSVEAANLLINYFGADKLNKYFESKGYLNTHFEGAVGTEGSYTTSEDLVKLMNKFYQNTSFFPYSDMYKKMRNNVVDDKITKSLPDGASAVNITFTTGEETVDAAIVYTPSGNFIFVAMAEGDKAGINAAHKAMSVSAKKICEALQE